MISETKQLEIELKLIIPVDKIEKLKRFSLFAAGNSCATNKSLYNAYFDTPNADLAKNKVALRIRQQDNDTYIQTLKTAGSSLAGLHQRGEWEWLLPDNTLNLAHLKEAAWPPVLSIDEIGGQLETIFTTNFNRQSWLIEHHGVEVEVVLDQGEVSAGSLSTPLCEVELELVNSTAAESLDVLYHLAEKLAAWVPVRLSEITKAERGYRLVQQQALKKTTEKPEREPQVDEEWSEDATLSALSRSFTDSIRSVELIDTSTDIDSVLKAWREFEGWVYTWLASHSSPLPLPVYQYLQSLHQWFMGVALGKHNFDGSLCKGTKRTSKSSQELNIKQLGFSQIAISRWFTQLHLMQQPTWPSAMTAKRQWCQDLLSDALLMNQGHGGEDAGIGTILSVISRLSWSQMHEDWEALPVGIVKDVPNYLDQLQQLVALRMLDDVDESEYSNKDWLDQFIAELRNTLVKPYA